MRPAPISPAMQKLLADIRRREAALGRAVDVSSAPASTVAALLARGMIATRAEGEWRAERWRGYGQSKYRELAPPRPVVVAHVLAPGHAALAAMSAGALPARTKANASAPLHLLAAESLRAGRVVVEKDPGRLRRARRAATLSQGPVPSTSFSYGDGGVVRTVIVWARTRPERDDPSDLWLLEGPTTRGVSFDALPPPVRDVARRVQRALRGE